MKEEEEGDRSAARSAGSSGTAMSLHEGEDAYKVSETAYSEMLRRGIKLPDKPNGFSENLFDDDQIPIIPPNILDLSDRQLGELSTIVQLYYSYVLGQLADAKNRYKEAKERHDFVSSKVRLTKDGTSADKDSRKVTVPTSTNAL